jgi:hypothetical protein
MTIFVVAFYATEQASGYEPPASGALAYVFTDRGEAEQFRDHVVNLYGFEAEVIEQSIDTYDSAISALVDAIGPSPE